MHKNKGTKNNRIKGILLLSSAAAIWGGMFVVSKYTLDFISPSVFITARYIVALLILFPLCIKEQLEKGRIKLAWKDWSLLFLIGFIGYFLSILFQFYGTKLTDAHTGSLLTTISPIFTFILAFFILNEKINTIKLVSVALSFFGIAMVMDFNFSLSVHFWGILLLFLAALTWAGLSVLVKLALRKFSSLFITTYAILFALLCSLPSSMPEIFNTTNLWNSSIILSVLYTGIAATAGAYYLWNKGLEFIDAGMGSLLIFFQTITGTILGYIFLDEAITINFIIGSVIIFAGMLFSAYSSNKSDNIKQ